MSSNIQITKTCICCGKEFTARTLHTRYCSHTCNRKHYKHTKRNEKLQQHKPGAVIIVQPTGSKQPIATTIQDKQFLSINEAARKIYYSLVGRKTET